MRVVATAPVESLKRTAALMSIFLNTGGSPLTTIFLMIGLTAIYFP